MKYNYCFPQYCQFNKIKAWQPNVFLKMSLDTRKNERQMSVSTLNHRQLNYSLMVCALNHAFGKCQTCQCLRCNGKQRMIHSQP
jgi:hypothetical protein